MNDILVVEDNKEISNLMTAFLRKAGYTVAVADSGDKAIEVYEKYGARLLLLDIMLPGLDGFSVCAKIRETSNTPILIISAKSDKEDQLNGLALGADDFIEKPVDIDILLAKIKGIFRRRYDMDELRVGSLVLNKATSEVMLDGKPVEIRAKEFELLELLVSNKGTTLKKDYLFNAVWGASSDSEMQTLTVHINRLREKLEKDPKKPEHILTVWGMGYRYE